MIIEIVNETRVEDNANVLKTMPSVKEFVRNSDISAELVSVQRRIKFA